MSNSYLSIELAGETIVLHPLRAIHWPARKLVFLADLHLGKTDHFRKKGIPVPAQARHENFRRLEELLEDTQPARVLFLGDLFHSEWNHQWEQVGAFLKSYESISFELVAGNHDILAERYYTQNNIKVYPKELMEGPFLLTHEPLESPGEGYNLAGHIHPGVTLRGAGRQALRLPCFYFGKHGGILPAFGALTGTARIKPQKGDRIFGLLEGEVIPL